MTEKNSQTKEEALKRFVLYGIIFEIMNNFHRPFAVKFLERIGGGDLAMSLFNSLPGLITLFAVIPGALFIRRLPSLKKTTLQLIGLGRIFLLFMAAIPFLPTAYRVFAFLMLYALMCFPDAVYQTAYQAYIGHLFKEKDRANAISRRNKLVVPVVTVMTLFIGKILTDLPKTDSERMLIYQFFYLAAFLFGLLEIVVFRKFRASEGAIGKPLDFKTSFKHLVQDKKFMFFTACSLIFHFGWQMGWPLFNIYTIKDLGADEMWLAILSVASSVAMFFAYNYWNKMIHRRGNAFVLAVNTLGMAITPIMYVYSFNLYVLTITSLVSGIFVAGTTTVLLSGLLEATPEEDRVIYLAVYSTLTNVSLAVAPLVGHIFLSAKGIVFALWMTAFFRTLGSLAFFYRNHRLKNQGV